MGVAQSLDVLERLEFALSQGAVRIETDALQGGPNSPRGLRQPNFPRATTGPGRIFLDGIAPNRLVPLMPGRGRRTGGPPVRVARVERVQCRRSVVHMSKGGEPRRELIPLLRGERYVDHMPSRFDPVVEEF